jgi:hypothetical protein
MHNANGSLEAVGRQWNTVTVLLGWTALMIGCVQLVFGQTSGQPTFASAEQASSALFAAVRANNEQTIMRILGGAKELVSSGEELDDKRDREQFVHKYEEMHRLVAEPDGTTFLYIGAENWPFPVPVAYNNGRWYFDADAGAQEIFFRQIGENEETAIATCRALALKSKQPGSKASGDAPIDRYARSLITVRAGSAGRASTVEATSAPFHGYRFRVVPQSKTGSTSNRFIFVAYPAEYRDSGVMTFVASSNGGVYQRDLGPDTAKLAQSINEWTPDANWHPVQ